MNDLRSAGASQYAGHPLAQTPHTLGLFGFKDLRPHSALTLRSHLGGTLDVEGLGLGNSALGPCWLPCLLRAGVSGPVIDNADTCFKNPTFYIPNATGCPVKTL